MELGTAISSIKIADCQLLHFSFAPKRCSPLAQCSSNHCLILFFFLKDATFYLRQPFQAVKVATAYSRNNLENKINAVCTSFFVVLYEDVRDTIHPIVVKFYET